MNQTPTAAEGIYIGCRTSSSSLKCLTNRGVFSQGGGRREEEGGRKKEEGGEGERWRDLNISTRLGRSYLTATMKLLRNGNIHTSFGVLELDS